MRTFTKALFILMLFLAGVQQLQAQSKAPAKLGKASEIKATFETKAKANKVKGARAQVSHKLPGQSPLVLNLKSYKKEGAVEVFYGEVEDAKNSSFYLKVAGNSVTGSILLKDEKKYYEYSSSADGTVYLAEKAIDKVLCVEYTESPNQVNTASNQASAGVATVPKLESLPGAKAVVLLDFDGQTVAGTLWNDQFTGGAPIMAAPAYLSEEEMVEVWKMMSEDFRPFALNITTDEAVFNKVPVDRRVRLIFTPTNYFFPGAGGAAYVGSFLFGGYSYGETPAFVWNSGIIGAGEAGSHEIGHTLNLVHDGRTAPYYENYYYGHDSWAPIMGVGYYRSVVQWSKGEYPDANNKEDDLYTITTYHGFGYRADDHGDTKSAATRIVTGGGGSVSPSANKGVISTQTDVDVFSFTTGGGRVNLQVKPDPSYPNLDIMLTLRNSSGSVVAQANPETMEASLSQNLAAGTYYLEIDGVMGALGANSDYGSLGQYFISGSIPTNAAPVVAITSPTNGQKITIPQNPINIVAHATDADGTIAKVEFFSGATKIGEDLKAPYSLSWRQPHKGAYSITAVATDNKGAKTTSAAVLIEVIKPGNGNAKKAAVAKNATTTELVEEELLELEVYPNPAGLHKAIQVALPTHYTEVSITIHKLSTGKKVSERSYTDTQTVQLDASNLASGLYGLTIIAEGKVWTKKLIIMPTQ